MRLFVGLGNPGAKYAQNRHNIGFMAVEEIARRHGFAPWRRRFQGETSEGTLDRERVVLLKPATYMNESGRAVQEAANFFKIAAGDITVFQDELELPAAKVRVKVGGGIAGHNGLRSITSHIGNDYRRVRLGIGHPGIKELVHHHVLSDFAKSRPAVGGGAVRRGGRQCRAAGDGTRTRRSRTRCIWRCRPRDFSTRTITERSGLTSPPSCPAVTDTLEPDDDKPDMSRTEVRWDSNAVSSDCPMSASRRCSTR